MRNVFEVMLLLLLLLLPLVTAHAGGQRKCVETQKPVLHNVFTYYRCLSADIFVVYFTSSPIHICHLFILFSFSLFFPVDL